jgi:hypothetical protein
MRPVVPVESEASFQSRVIKLASANGWKVCHFRPKHRQRGSRVTGFPDLVLAKKRDGKWSGGIIFAELKRDGEWLDPAQVEWAEVLSAANSVEVCMWRPSDWAAIEARLRI